MGREHRIDRAARVVAAAPDAAWSALTDAASPARWLPPAAQGTVISVTHGRRMIWDVVLASEQPDRAGPMRMLWTLTPAGAGTRVTVEAIDPPSGIDRAEHEAALAVTLDRLAAELASA